MISARHTRSSEPNHRAFQIVWGVALAAVLAICPVATGQAGPESAGSPRGTYRIAGTVVNSITGSALAQARVALVETSTRKNIATLTTSEDGHFEFSALPSGKYSLQGAKRGFITAAYEQHEQFSTAIVTGPDTTTDGLLLRLTPMALISGHVTDENGEPVRLAHVTLYLEDHRAGMNRVNRIANSITDDLGYFDFSMLRPGSYFVSVSAKPWYAINASTALQPKTQTSSATASVLDVAYQTTYYGGVTEAENATPIPLNGGDHPEINVQLNPVPALHILVRAERPRGEAGENAVAFRAPMLQKQVFDSLEGVQPGMIVPVEPGVFEMTGVPPGQYNVRLREGSSGDVEQLKNMNLTSDGQELDTSHGEPLSSLKITVNIQGDSKPPKQLFLRLQDQRHRIVAARNVDPTGEVKFEGIAPGKYTILSNSPEMAYAVSRTTLDGTESQGHTVNISPGSSPELIAWLVGGVVKVEGVVKKAGKPVAGVMVVLIPKDPEEHLEYFRRDQSDLDGTFTVAGVIPGTYTIVAVEDAWGFEWLKPGVLARYAEHGQELTIGPLMQGSVHLPDPVEVQPR